VPPEKRAALQKIRKAILPAGLVKKLVKARMAELKRAHDESM
jgi:hypothetical protein